MRRARKRLRDNRVECALRPDDGSTVGTENVWSHGDAHLLHGELIFTPTMGSVGVRLITVASIDASRPRRPEGKEAWNNISPNLVVWRLSTPTGAMEWAVHHKLMAEAAGLLHVPVTRAGTARSTDGYLSEQTDGRDTGC